MLLFNPPNLLYSKVPLSTAKSICLKKEMETVKHTQSPSPMFPVPLNYNEQ